ncbi:MAG: hypothetical protein J5J00_16575 [Deltaproteobacteria bacterium]|nr:hypothetical protein [Deltaproteobacteria bacterium]
MNDITLWKLLIDAGILISCGGLGLALFRSQRPAFSPQHLIELNTKLQSVIREADETGRNLNEQLMRRQEQLQKLLFDVDSIEHRINRLLTSSEERKGTLELESEKVKQLLVQLDEQAKSAQEVQKALSKDKELVQSVISAVKLLDNEPETNSDADMHDAPEPPSFEETVIVASEGNEQGSKQSEPEAANVFGDQIQESNSSDHYQPLSASIEKEVAPTSPGEAQAGLSQLEDVYTAAENLLKAGRDLEQVAVETSLPIEEVRMLRRIIEQDQEMRREDDAAVVEIAGKDESDARLGVLGRIKRHVPFF